MDDFEFEQADDDENSLSFSSVSSFTRHNPYQSFLAILLVLDVAIVIANVLFDAEHPECAAALRTCGLDPQTHSCVDPSNQYTILSDVFTGASICILFVFTGDLLFMLWKNGLYQSLTRLSFIFDASIVIASIIMELLEIRNHHDTGLLVLGRVWRFVSLGSDFADFHKTRSRRLLTREGLAEYRALHSLE
jgi:hypothetical protein